MVGTCKRMGIGTVAFYVLGFLTDTWNSISATIEYSISLNSTYAQFKLLTPYPGTALYRRLEPLVYEKDWEKSTDLLQPSNTPSKPRGTLISAWRRYARFYMRPYSWPTSGA
jgi:radical SAM superfamily enzyme YgiQ (UPF0313 family)